MESLSGKTAVVTGAASGIGAALAEKFLSVGMSVVLADVERTALEDTARRLGTMGDVAPVLTDVSDHASVSRLRDTALERFGAVHVLCNNAGVGGGGPMSEVAIETWRWTLGVNLWGVIHGVSAFLPALLEQGEGHIVNTASVAGLVSFPNMGPYNVSKYGVVALSETLYQELIQSDAPVGVTVLCPGFVATNIIDSERNRPETMQPSGPNLADSAAEAERAALREMAKELYRTQLAPAAVADMVHDAILAKRLYCFTDEMFQPLLRDRAEALLAGADLANFGQLFERLTP